MSPRAALLLLLLACALAQAADDAQVAALVRELQELQSKGIDVAPLAQALDRALAANLSLEAVEANVTALKAQADWIYLQNSVFRYGTAALLLASPVAVYFLLPRVYLALWYRTRRRWLVRHARR